MLMILFSASLGVKLAEAEPGASEELIGYLEAAVMEQVEQKGLSRLGGCIYKAWFMLHHGDSVSPVQTLCNKLPLNVLREGNAFRHESQSHH